MNIYKRMIPILLFGAVASSTSFAQVNNTGQIVLQGAVPGCWELTVYDINSGFDFDLRDTTADLTTRVGTIHIFTNDSSTADGHLFIQSANDGVLRNSPTIPGIAAENQHYRLSLLVNTISEVTGSALTPSGGTLTVGANGATGFNLVTPATLDFAGDGTGTIKEVTYDVEITIPGQNRPQASGVYTDTITFTIMDEN